MGSQLGAYLEIGPHAHIQVIYPKSAVTGEKFSVFFNAMPMSLHSVPKECKKACESGNKTVLINLCLSQVNRALLGRVVRSVSDTAWYLQLSVVLWYRRYPCDVQYRRWVSAQYPPDGLYHPVSQSA